MLNFLQLFHSYYNITNGMYNRVDRWEEVGGWLGRVSSWRLVIPSTRTQAAVLFL